jgi:hypothetical protein
MQQRVVLKTTQVLVGDVCINHFSVEDVVKGSVVVQILQEWNVVPLVSQLLVCFHVSVVEEERDHFILKIGRLLGLCQLVKHGLATWEDVEALL